MTLQRQIRKENEKKQACSNVAAANSVEEENLCKVLEGVPKEVVQTLFLLCKLAYCGFFNWYESEWWNDPKIIFTVEDLKKCGIEVTTEWDGYGLLKATHTHQLPTDTVTYNFSHLTIQEFLCAVYVSTLSQEDQQFLIKKHFSEYPNVFVFLCGLTGLVSSKMFQFVFSSNLPKFSNGFVSKKRFMALLFKVSKYSSDIVTFVKCLYESQMTCLPQPAAPVDLDVSECTLLPHDCLCISYVLSCYPVSKLNMSQCHITDKGAELLVKFPYKNTTGQLLEALDLSFNDLTIDGLLHIMEIIKTSKSRY